jgi:uncharacterized protein YkwD
VRILTRSLATLLLLLVAAWTGAMRATADATPEERAAEVKLLRIINKAREAKGLRVLKEHDVIREEAEAHSERMARQQTLSHNAFEARATRIANADSGIDPDQICENVGFAEVSKMARAMKGIFRAWKQSQEQADCLFDALGYSTRSGAAGVVFVDGRWWVTIIAAHDETR